MKTEFRTESCYGEGIRSPVKVIRYEFFEMGNTDIVEYILKHYSVPANQADFWVGLMDELCDNGYVDDMSIIDQEESIKELLGFVQASTHTSIHHVLWLTDKENVKGLYGGVEGEIDEYEVSNVILSDIGPDGRLYAFSNNPEPINH